MKALKLIKPGQVEVVDVPEPEITKNDQMKIKVRASSICNQYEYKLFSGLLEGNLKPSYPAEPGFPGHEGAGEVIETGKNVKTLKPGDKVILCGWAGHLHQEYIVCSGEWPQAVRTDADFADLAPAEIYGCTRATIERGEFIEEGHCVVIGLGPAGLSAIEWFRLFGAKKITCVDIMDDKLVKGLEMGADDAASAKDKSRIKKLLTEKPETVMDCSGTHEGFNLAFKMADREALLFGYNDKPFKVNQAEWLEKSLSIKTKFAFDLDTWKKTATMISRGLINPGRIVSHLLPFSAESYTKAMDLMKKPGTYKVILEY